MGTVSFSEERCIACGASIPEGRLICPHCEQKHLTTKDGTDQPMERKALGIRGILRHLLKKC